MKTDDEIREYKNECREESLIDNKHKEDMRNDFDYFLKEPRDYGWCDKPEELVV